MKVFLLLLLSTLMVCSCQRKDPAQQQIAGIYAREISFEVTHPETSKRIGRSSVRDTLYIQERAPGFEVRQTKWRLNDFDRQGWRDQRHADNRPAPAYEATFDPADRCLRPASTVWGVALYVDGENNLIYQGSNRHQPYRKVP